MIQPDLLSADLVVGTLPDRLVAVPAPLLAALIEGRRADATARTWGEFRAAAPGVYGLLWDGDELADDEPFASLVDNDGFPYASALMLDGVPQTLQVKLGSTASDTYGDTWLHIAIEDPDDAEAVARAVRIFRDHGYTVRSDDAAVRYVSGIDL